MDFGGFIVEIGLIALSGFSVVVLVVLLARKSKFTKAWLGLTVATIVLTAVGGTYLYQVYELDEPMAFAAQSGDEDEVERLLKEGADPNAISDGKTAMEWAKEGDHTLIVRLLRRHGARE